eukprot:SAG11_NODE_3312_length_2529_cov_1.876955_2_plen_68_part_00
MIHTRTRKPQLFELLEAHPKEIQMLDKALVQEVIYQAILGKAEGAYVGRQPKCDADPQAGYPREHAG